jgi:phage I-like protein
VLHLCKLVLSEDGEPPEWIEIIPPGKVTALDGRKFNNADPQAVVDAFNATDLDLPIDFEHATEIKAPLGEEAPASGWIKELEVRGGSIWARVEWTPRGEAALRNKEYRYVSPAFHHTKDGIVLRISSVGLVNKPALDQLAAVASEDRQNSDNRPSPSAGAPNKKAAALETSMNPEILAALGLKADASEDEVLAAVQSFRAAKQELAAKLNQTREELAVANAKEPALDKFVPRADHDAVKCQLDEAQAALHSIRQEAADKEVAQAIDAALKAGKITPATVDYHKAQCSQEGGLELFRKFVEAAPVIGDDSGLDDKKAPGKGARQLSDEEKAVCQSLGLSEEQFRAAL